MNRLSDATHFMKQSGPLWFATTDKGTDRYTIADLGKRIAQLQRTSALPCYAVTVYECSGDLHAHMIFVGNGDIAHRLERSQFVDLIEVKRVNDLAGLVRDYLAKERTPQAGWGRKHKLGRRRKGSHRLAGGGDRVRLSPDLERDAIAASYVKPWRKTNARRTEERKPYRPRRLIKKALRLSGQIPLLPELERPVARLRDFGGGVLPPAVACELEFRRQCRGLTQHDLARLIGIQQPHYANAIRGHDPLSAYVVRRLREVLQVRINRNCQ